MQSMTIEQLRAATHAGGVAGVTLKGLGGSDPVWQEHLRAAGLHHLQPADAPVRAGTHPAAGLAVGPEGLAPGAGSILVRPADVLLALAGPPAHRRHPGAGSAVIFCHSGGPSGLPVVWADKGTSPVGLTVSKNP